MIDIDGLLVSIRKKSQFTLRICKLIFNMLGFGLVVVVACTGEMTNSDMEHKI